MFCRDESCLEHEGNGKIRYQPTGATTGATTLPDFGLLYFKSRDQLQDVMMGLELSCRGVVVICFKCFSQASCGFCHKRGPVAVPPITFILGQLVSGQTAS